MEPGPRAQPSSRLIGLPICHGRPVSLSRWIWGQSTGDWQAECQICKRVDWLDAFFPRRPLEGCFTMASLRGLTATEQEIE